ncbi:hypothetical protein AB4099_20020 [Bosea sp. 2KB_26]|uniref:hypothetical protein n=1 Tax=Bosea sp. 2KB_26 TaxID=3237475 RepID=UPI003F91C121
MGRSERARTLSDPNPGVDGVRHGSAAAELSGVTHAGSGGAGRGAVQARHAGVFNIDAPDQVQFHEDKVEFSSMLIQS